MKEKQLLFVAYHDEDFNEGLTYAVDLAKARSNSIFVLIVYRPHFDEKPEEGIMKIRTAASAGPDEGTAGKPVTGNSRRDDLEKKLLLIRDICRKGGVSVDVGTAVTAVIPAIKRRLSESTGIDMVLLGPGITNDGSINSKTLGRLVKTASRPIVTMAKQAGPA